MYCTLGRGKSQVLSGEDTDDQYYGRWEETGDDRRRRLQS